MPSEQDALRKDQFFAQLAVKKKVLTEEEAESALEDLKDLKSRGVARRLADILVEKKLITSGQSRQLQDLVDRSLLSCPGCQALFNVEGFAPGKRFICKRCKEILTVPSPAAVVPPTLPLKDKVPPH